MPLVTTRAGATAGGLGWSASSNVKYAMELVKPTSVTKVGASSTATITTNGSVDFSGCETLNLNGVFSSLYDNYMIVQRTTVSATTSIYMRLRANGTDSANSSYTRQYLEASAGGIGTARATNLQQILLTALYSPQREGQVVYLYGPFLNEPTAGRLLNALSLSSAYFWDVAFTHNLSTSYDGFSFYTDQASVTWSGNIAVYGLVG